MANLEKKIELIVKRLNEYESKILGEEIAAPENCGACKLFAHKCERCPMGIYDHCVPCFESGKEFLSRDRGIVARELLSCGSFTPDTPKNRAILIGHYKKLSFSCAKWAHNNGWTLELAKLTAKDYNNYRWQ